jgi:hypothetical protein
LGLGDGQNGQQTTETENGQLEAKQNDWEKRIAGGLTALAAFAERP